LIALLEAIDLSLVSFPLQFSPSVCMFGHVMRCLATHLDVVDCCLFTILHIFFFFFGFWVNYIWAIYSLFICFYFLWDLKFKIKLMYWIIDLFFSSSNMIYFL
jgi:hypothetical protein